MIISQYSFWPLVLFSQEKNIFTVVENHFKKSQFYDRASEASSVNFQRFCAKNEYFLLFGAKIQMRLFKVIFKTLCIHAT